MQKSAAKSHVGALADFHWIHCICAINFDLDAGQKLEFTIPETKFKKDDLIQLGFLSFPDTNSHMNGDVQYCFRFIRAQDPETKEDPEPLYGFSFFRQKKDPSVKRGFLQKSVVLLSVHPYFSLFRHVMSQLGPTYFDMGNELLVSVYNNIQSWSVPTPGKSVDLALVGKEINFESPLPVFYAMPSDPAQLARVELSGHVGSMALMSHLHEALPSLWHLWELVLCAQPLLVFAPSPAIASDAVLALVSLIYPLAYCGDFRPYFNVQDPDMKRLQALKAQAASMLLGVTNPLIGKLLNEWPNRLALSSNLKGGSTAASSGSTSDNNTTSSSSNASATTPSSTSASNASNTSAHIGGLLITPSQVGMMTTNLSTKQLLGSDRDVIAQVSSFKAQNPSEAASGTNDLLRRHFMQKTIVFMAPLEEYQHNIYVASSKDMSLQRLPRMKPFQIEEFVTWLKDKEKAKPVDQFQEKRLALYRSFAQSPNFAGWWTLRCAEAQAKLEVDYIRVIDTLPAVAKDKNEVEKVDLYIRCQELLSQLKAKTARRALKVQMDSLVKQLPEDLQNSLALARERPPSEVGSPQQTQSRSSDSTTRRQLFAKVIHSQTAAPAIEREPSKPVVPLHVPPIGGMGSAVQTVAPAELPDVYAFLAPSDADKKPTEVAPPNRRKTSQPQKKENATAAVTSESPAPVAEKSASETTVAPVSEVPVLAPPPRSPRAGPAAAIAALSREGAEPSLPAAATPAVRSESSPAAATATDEDDWGDFASAIGSDQRVSAQASFDFPQNVSTPGTSPISRPPGSLAAVLAETGAPAAVGGELATDQPSPQAAHGSVISASPSVDTLAIALAAEVTPVVVEQPKQNSCEAAPVDAQFSSKPEVVAEKSPSEPATGSASADVVTASTVASSTQAEQTISSEPHPSKAQVVSASATEQPAASLAPSADSTKSESAPEANGSAAGSSLEAPSALTATTAEPASEKAATLPQSADVATAAVFDFLSFGESAAPPKADTATAAPAEQPSAQKPAKANQFDLLNLGEPEAGPAAALAVSSPAGTDDVWGNFSSVSLSSNTALASAPPPAEPVAAEEKTEEKTEDKPTSDASPPDVTF